MGAFTSYSLSVAVFLFLGWTVYRFALSGCKQTAFNRRTILAVYVFSFIAMPLGSALEACVSLFSRGAVPGIGIGVSEVVFDVPSATAAPEWPLVLVAGYFAGVLVVALRFAAGLLSVCVLIRKGERREMDGFTFVSLPADSRVAPFSFGRYVVASEAELNVSPLILSHELGHIASGHRYDLMLANLVCVIQWFNPAAWLLRSDLRCLHEYEADEMVLAGGADMRQYQRLLVGRSIGGARSKFMSNSFNSNLKKRIAMMYLPSSSGRMRFRALALVPALALAFGLVNIPAVASVLSATATARFPENLSQDPSGASNKDVRIIVLGNDKAEAPVAGEVLPQYPGGEQAMFRFLAENIKYPESMVKDNISGRVLVRFTVEADGALSDIKVVEGLSPDADREVVRVVASMPRWIPGTSDGKPVACGFAMPVSFRLVDDSSAADGNQPLKLGSGENAPVIFINGELFTEDLNSISTDDIESITVRKDLPEYPNGLIDITLKKK